MAIMLSYVAFSMMSGLVAVLIVPLFIFNK